MVYAQIKNNIIQNTIVVDDETPMELFSQGFDHFLRIDDLDEVPGIGWSYADDAYTRPPEPVEMPVE